MRCGTGKWFNAFGGRRSASSTLRTLAVLWFVDVCSAGHAKHAVSKPGDLTYCLLLLLRLSSDSALPPPFFALSLSVQLQSGCARTAPTHHKAYMLPLLSACRAGLSFGRGASSGLFALEGGL